MPTASGRSARCSQDSSGDTGMLPRTGTANPTPALAATHRRLSRTRMLAGAQLQGAGRAGWGMQSLAESPTAFTPLPAPRCLHPTAVPSCPMTDDGACGADVNWPPPFLSVSSFTPGSSSCGSSAEGEEEGPRVGGHWEWLGPCRFPSGGGGVEHSRARGWSPPSHPMGDAGGSTEEEPHPELRSQVSGSGWMLHPHGPLGDA